MIFELFSQRNSEKKDIDVYEYENFPQEFRNQVFFIISDFFGLYEHAYSDYGADKIWERIYDIYIRQKGIKRITTSERFYNKKRDVEIFFYEAKSDDVLDFIDLTFQCIDKVLRNQSFHGYSSAHEGENEQADNAIKELNYRLRQHGLGYEFVDGQIIKKSNELIHQEIVKPALLLLHNKKFKGAEYEFLKAFDSYKAGNNKDALMNAQRAFESTMKCICKEKKIFYKEEDTSRALVKHLIENGFLPAYQDSFMNNLEQVLSGGLPTVRNKEAGHGQGDEVKTVDNTLVEYAIHLAATNIVYLVSLLKK